VKKIVYLDIAYGNPLPNCVRKAITSFLLDVQKRGIMKNEYLKKGEEVRGKFASLINADLNEIAFIKNTSEGINIAANGIKFNPGDNIIINELEHGSNFFPWINIKNNDVEVKIIPHRSGTIETDDIASEIDSRTRAVSISSIQYQGFKTDIQKLSEVCRENSVYLIVDAIQSLGNEAMDVKKVGVDMMSAQCHKGLLGPYGIGFFYCSDEIVEDIHPPYVSTTSYESGDPLLPPRLLNPLLKKTAAKFEYGCQNYLGFYAMDAALDLLHRVGVKNIASKTFELAERFRDDLGSISCETLDSPDVNERSHIVMFNVPGKSFGEVTSSLGDNGIRVSGRHPGIRASFGLYNSMSDVERTIEAIEKIDHK
jgi:selenocysteine lyase/cysteine desulfurase